MLSAAQLAEVEKSMEEEHRKDREALERLKRFASSGNGNNRSHGVASVVEQIQAEVEALNTDTIIGKVETVIASDPERRWSVPAMLVHLRNEKFPLVARKPESTLGLVFAKLYRRGKIRLVRRGGGRKPSVYRASTQQEADSVSSPNGERATQGQPVTH